HCWPGCRPRFTATGATNRCCRSMSPATPTTRLSSGSWPPRKMREWTGSDSCGADDPSGASTGVVDDREVARDRGCETVVERFTNQGMPDRDFLHARHRCEEGCEIGLVEVVACIDPKAS